MSSQLIPVREGWQNVLSHRGPYILPGPARFDLLLKYLKRGGEKNRQPELIEELASLEDALASLPREDEPLLHRVALSACAAGCLVRRHVSASGNKISREELEINGLIIHAKEVNAIRWSNEYSRKPFSVSRPSRSTVCQSDGLAIWQNLPAFGVNNLFLLSKSYLLAGWPESQRTKAFYFPVEQLTPFMPYQGHWNPSHYLTWDWIKSISPSS